MVVGGGDIEKREKRSGKEDAFLGMLGGVGGGGRGAEDVKCILQSVLVLLVGSSLVRAT